MNERTEPIRVTIVEDHADFREGLRLMLTSSGKFTVVGAFPSVESALRELPECDVLLLDINLPGKSGTESIPLFKRSAPSTQVVMMTGLDDDDSIFGAILAGADGYLLKKTAPAKVLTAVEDAAAGGTPMTPFVARRVIEQILAQKGPEPQLFNINIPSAALDRPTEVKLVPMGLDRYGESYEKRIDPRGRAYYWSTNDPPPKPGSDETDCTALAKGFVTLTPLDFDLTKRSYLERMQPWKFAPIT